VRDMLRGQTPPDFDIATDAAPDDIKKVFENLKTIDTGVRHGTVGVVLAGRVYEITTFRKDGKYTDSRHPESVTFVSDLTDDLKRRDFTINAMAMGSGGGVIDPFGGQADLKNELIRAVGDPDARFKEDALRIMRALRFSSVLGFEIEKNTEISLFENRLLLNEISKERISDELKKLLCGKNVLDVLLKYKEIFGVIIPELEPTFGFLQKTPHHVYDVWEHTARAVSDCESFDYVFSFALLLHDVAKPKMLKYDDVGVAHFKGHAAEGASMAHDILSRLHFPKRDIGRVADLIQHHDVRFAPDTKTVRRAIAEHGVDFLRDLIVIQRADARSHSGDSKDASLLRLQKFEEILNAQENIAPQSVKDLKISGDDLLTLGMKSGPEIKSILLKLLMLVADQEIQNERGELLNMAKELI